MDEGSLLFFTTKWFQAGASWGALALGVGLIVDLLWRSWRRQPAPVVGGLVVVAALMAMPIIRESPVELWLGVGMLAVAGLLFPWARKVQLLPALLAAPGAWWVTQVVDLPGEEWASRLLFGTVVVGAPLVASFDRQHVERGYGPVLLAVTIGGAFTTLPDTEEILVLFGAALPAALLAWPKPFASLGAWGVYPVAGVFAWVAAWGGRGRETAIIGTVACLGLLVAEPIARWFSRRSSTLLDRLPDNPGGSVLAGLAQLVVVLGAARVAGLQAEVVTAAVIAGLVLIGAVVLLAVSGPSHPRQPGRHRR